VTKMHAPFPAPGRHGVRQHRASWWPATAPAWMGSAFLIAFVLAVLVLAIFGVGERGTREALRVTARWSFLLFWFAYAGSAMAKIFGSHFDGLARHAREFGLSFAAAHLVHVGLVLWLYYILGKPPLTGGLLIFFSVGLSFTYLLALFSLPRARKSVGRLWPILRTVALEYIALAFAADFVIGPLETDGLGRFPHSYMPLALMLIAGVCLRTVAFARRMLAPTIRSVEKPAAFKGGGKSVQSRL